MASPIDGRAVSMLVKLGDKVRAGQPLIELSSPNVGQLQADAQKAMSDLNDGDFILAMGLATGARRRPARRR